MVLRPLIKQAFLIVSAAKLIDFFDIKLNDSFQESMEQLTKELNEIK